LNKSSLDDESADKRDEKIDADSDAASAKATSSTGAAKETATAGASSLRASAVTATLTASTDTLSVPSHQSSTTNYEVVLRMPAKITESTLCAWSVQS
jgi:hypothetical protein